MLIRSLFLTTALIAAAGPAVAQTIDPAATARLHFGPVALTPRIFLTNAGIDTNVFNAADDESPRRDFTATVQPKLDLWMHLGRALASATVTKDLVYYKSFASERSVNSEYRAGLRVPLNRLTLNGDITYLKSRERPGFEIDARSQRDELGSTGSIEVRAFPKTFISATASRTRINFSRDAVFLGASLRDELTRTATSRAVSVRYALTPLTDVSLDVSQQTDRFPYSPLRDSDSTQVRIGFKFDPFAIVKGNMVIGYRSFQPRMAGVRGYKGPAGTAELSYVAFGTTKLSVEAQRDVQYSFSVDQPYYVLTGRSFSVSQLVAGQIDAVGRVGVQRLEYRDRVGVAVEVSNRTDDIHTYGGGLGYRLGKDLRLGVNIDWARRTSGVQGHSYSGLRIGTAITYGQ